MRAGGRIAKEILARALTVRDAFKSPTQMHQMIAHRKKIKLAAQVKIVLGWIISFFPLVQYLR